MTTIILTTIGILLAAAAALMVVFYGGDTFRNGTVGAEANTYMNVGTNALAAVDRYRMDMRRDPAGFDELVSSGYMTPPALPRPGQVSLTAEGNGGRFAITGVNLGICAQINRTAGRPEAEWADPANNANDGTGKMGCRVAGGSGVFYILT